MIAFSFPQAMLSENCCFLEQIMSTDKYPSIFSRQMEAIVYILAYVNWDSTFTVMSNRLQFSVLICREVIAVYMNLS